MPLTAAACSSCRAPLAPSAQFCRACGTPTAESATAPAVPESATTARCHACGEGLAAEAAFCRACGAAAAEEPPTLVAPPAPEPAWTPAPSPTEAAPTGRSPWFAVGLAALVLLFGGGGGAAAYFLVVKKDETPGEATANASTPPPAAAPAASPEPVGESGTADGAPEDAADGDSETGGTSSASDEGDDSSGGSTGASSAASPGSPESVLRSHFEDIDNGDYDAAWRLLHPSYRNTTGANWVSQRESERAQIEVRSISRIGRPRNGVVKLDAEIVAADSAGDGAGVCRLFSGWTRMEKSGGKWTYRPGEVDGVKPGFSANATELDSSDSRCSSVLE